MNQDHANFKLYRDGFVMTFDNGYSVSVRWGTHNYADYLANNDQDRPVSLTAEVAILLPSNSTFDFGKFYHLDGYYMYYGDDDVLSNCSAEEVANILKEVSQKDNIND